MEEVEAELSEARLVGFSAGDLTSCTTGPELEDLSSFFSSGLTVSSFFSLFLSSSNFSGLSSLRTRGRVSLVLPLTIKFVSPREMSSLSSVLITSCLKENADIAAGLDAEAGGTALGGSASGALSEGRVGAAASPSAVGRTFLTTRRTTFTTFFRVRTWSSVVSMWLVPVPGSLPLPPAVPLAMLLPVTPFCSWSPFIPGSGLRAA